MKDLLKTVAGALARANANTQRPCEFRQCRTEKNMLRTCAQGRDAVACTTERIAASGGKRGVFALAFLLTVVALFVACSLVVPQETLAYNPDGRTVEVSNVDELLTEISASRMMSYEANIVLTDDIDFNEFDPEGSKLQEIVDAYGSLTFGTKDHPFKGSLDGQGHYIIGLNYNRDFWKPLANTGLFSFTEDAYIHDIHFKDCYIGADFRGGVLVGQAWNTHIESVRMEDCTISVTPANNSVSLITNAGIMGGIIAGELRGGSYMYDCTVQGGRAVNNSVVGVSGLGGEGLYLGALVGSAENSQIEYCRVLPKEQYYIDRAQDPNVTVYDRDENGHYKYQTEVYNRYEVAVGAVAGQSVYAGGIVGFIKDVDVVDCFSTAWVHTWVANYVGVGAGNIGYVGGIAAHSKSDDTGDTTSQIIRCHYAGNMESYQWNSIAVIPIIQSNVYLAGLVERDWEEDTGIYNSYFKRNDIVGKDSAIEPYPDGYVRAWGDWLGLNYSGGENGPSAQGFGYGPIVDDAKYADRLFWEGEGYDFEGDEQRYSTIDNQIPAHVNKWIMDDYLGIPVHGDSVKATLDFPGAGDVTISQSTMGKEQTTADPYNFAVQAVSANETNLTFTATVDNDRTANDALKMVSSDANEGFRFQGWFRNKDVAANHIQQGSHAFFDSMVPPEPNGDQAFNDAGNQLNLVYTAVNSGTGADEGAAFSNNDLFVAYYQAQVLFHGVDGVVLDLTGATNADASDDWYNHQEALPTVPEPAGRAGVDEGAKFLGWTTQKNGTTGGGWPDVTTSELNAMKANGEFFEGGESIERPMDLYPVYASLAANINVIAEGHELDPTSSDTNVREGVVQATVTAKDGKYELGINGLGAEGALPDGYRFLGWYEVELDEQGSPIVDSTHDGVLLYDESKWNNEQNELPATTTSATVYKHGLKLSADATYVIPDSVDLTQKHCYIARFEYRVDYYVMDPNPIKDTEWSKPYLLASVWEPYLGKFDNISGPYFYDWKHDHWTLDKIDGCEGSDAHLAQNQLVGGVVSSVRVNGHNVDVGGHANYGIDIYTDFPDSADIWTEHLASNGLFEAHAETHENFQLMGGTWVRTNDHDYHVNSKHHEAPHEYSWRMGTMLGTAQYWVEARLAAEVDFMDAAGTADAPAPVTVTRGYEKYENYDPATGAYENNYQPVLMSEDKTYTYRYPVREGFVVSESDETPMSAVQCDDKGEPLTTTSKASPSNEEMQQKRPDSLFLGWIDKSEITHGTMTRAEYEAVYDEVTRMAKVSLDAIAPYLVTEKTLCERPMQLYPVYADYSYETTTNITRDTALTDPANPTAAEVRNDDGTMTLTLSADVDVDTAAAYELTSWTVESPEGTVIDTIRTTDGTGMPATNGGAPVGNDNATFVYTIKAGSHYVIVANYEANRDAELDVTYHTNDGVTDVVKKHAGDALGKAPAASSDVPNAALVGWTEQQPADGAEYLMFDQADAAKMVDEYTLVQRPMELWPIYRIIGTEGDQANVRVNSNIDNTDGVGVDHRRAMVKTASTPQGSQTYVALEADAVDGYKFIGWYKDYIDMTVDADGKATVEGTLVPGNRVTGDEMFAGNLYTAVYQKTQVYKVVYHFPDMDGAGPETESADAIEFAADDTSAFVQKVTTEQPKKDENGNLVYDENGNVVMEKVEVEATVVGGEQTASMEGFLAQKDAQGQVKELFKEWEWKKSDTETLAWNEFCRASIVESMTNAGVTEMHLYPVAHRLNALDQDGAPYAASNLVWQIDPAALEKEVADPNAEGATPAVKIAFGPRTLYMGDTLTVHMDQVHYAKPETDRAAAVDGKLVALYDNFDFTKAKQLDKKATGHLGAGHEGDAVFEFDTSGSLTIDKTAPLMAAGSTFTFTVTECSENGEIAQDAKSATVTMTAQDNGQGAATASETINVPWGYYKVVETSWGWRYTPTYQFFEGGMTVEGRPDNVVLVRSQGTAKVTNTLANEEYLDGEDRAKNVFGEGRNPNENGGGQ